MHYNKTAIIVLDIQNDFCDTDGAFAKYLEWDPTPIQTMVPRLVRYIDEARAEGAQIVFSQMINSATASPTNLKNALSAHAESTASTWPFALARDSWGWELYRIQPQQGDVVLEKKYYDFFSNPQLKKLLNEHGIKTLVITGLYTEVCVFATAMRGFTEGYDIVVPHELTASIAYRSGLRDAALEILRNYVSG